jgi:hypothetical protein
MLVKTDIQWDPVTISGLTAISGGSDTTLGYSIRRQTQNGLTITSVSSACGGTSPDLCSPLFSQAFAQTLPDSIWDFAGAPKATATMTLPNSPDPGEAFIGPIESILFGLQLPDPFATWPSVYTDSSITWVDDDGDGQPGVTSIMLNTGTSSACGSPYANLPIPSDGNRAAKIFTGSRTLGNLDGRIADCNTITGNYHGPASGMPQVEGHVDGCIKSDNTACTAAETASLDSGATTSANRILSATFSLVRVADNITCAQVRAMTFP